jgi:chorismate mutase
VSRSVRALRGATTLDADSREQMLERVPALLREMLERNGLSTDDLVSVLLTATDDLHSMFPAEAARAIGNLDDVPLMCARELSVDGAMERCVRILAHVETDLARRDVRHVYLERARALRGDLVE